MNKLTKSELIEKLHEFSITESYWITRDKIVALINNTEIIPDPVPEVDTELEEAKKRFPVGSWFTDMDRGSTIFKVNDIKRVDREYKENVLVLTDCTGNWHCVDLCTPATLPTAKWRCMKTDIETPKTRMLAQLKRHELSRSVFVEVYRNQEDDLWCTESGIAIDLDGHSTALWLEIPRDQI